MRVIAELPHPDFKVSIFYMNGRFITKFEKGSFEQTYKVAEMDLTDGVNSVFELLDEAFMQTVAQRFEQMMNDFRGAYKRYN